MEAAAVRGEPLGLPAHVAEELVAPAPARADEGLPSLCLPILVYTDNPYIKTNGSDE